MECSAGPCFWLPWQRCPPERPWLRLSVRVEPLLPGFPLARQVEQVAAAGYQGFAFGDWRPKPPLLASSAFSHS